MSRVSRIALALLVFAFAFLFCATPFIAFSGGENTLNQLAPWIGLVVALAIAVGSYFAFDALSRWSSARREAKARALLAPITPAGETVQASTFGYVGPAFAGFAGADILLFVALAAEVINARRRKWYYVGLTERHLLLLQVSNNKPTGVRQVLARNEVPGLEFQSGIFKGSMLVIRLLREEMQIGVEQYGWRGRAKTLDNLWRRLPAQPGS